MANVKKFFIGWFLFILGLVMFLSKLTFNDPSNTGLLGDLMGSLLGNTSQKEMSGILIVVIMVMLLIFFISPNILTFIGVLASILLTVFAVISSMNISIASMSGLEIGIISVLIIAGMGIGFRATISLLATTDASKKSL